MKKTGVKERLKRISRYGLDPKEAIRAFMSIDPDELKELENREKQASEIWIANKKTDKN